MDIMLLKVANKRMKKLLPKTPSMFWYWAFTTIPTIKYSPSYKEMYAVLRK